MHREPFKSSRDAVVAAVTVEWNSIDHGREERACGVSVQCGVYMRLLLALLYSGLCAFFV